MSRSLIKGSFAFIRPIFSLPGCLIRLEASLDVTPRFPRRCLSQVQTSLKSSKLPWTLPLAFHPTVTSDAERDWRQPWILGWERLCSTQHKRPQVAPTKSSAYLARLIFGLFPCFDRGKRSKRYWLKPSKAISCFLFRRIPDDFVHARCFLALVFCHSSHGKCFATK